MATRNTKYTNIVNWILNNITADNLKDFNNNTTRCEYVISKLPSELSIDITPKQMYFILYKYKLLAVKLDGNKTDRINWLHQHKDEILNINYPTSKETNSSRITYTMEHMNQDLNMNYSRDQIRHFLLYQRWLMKHQL